MVSEKRVFAILAMVAGLAAGTLILSSAAGQNPVNLLDVVVGLGVLYGSYLIFRGRTSAFFGWAKARTGAFINLGLGILTLLVPGGVGGTAAVLAIVSGVLGFLSA